MLNKESGLCPAELQWQLAQAATGLIHHKVHELPGGDFLIAVLFQVMPLQYQACSSGAAGRVL